MTSSLMEQRLFSTVFALFWIQLAVVDGARKEPPEMYDNIRTRFRIPLGTKPFKLSCPIKSVGDTEADDGIMVKWSKDGEDISVLDWDRSQYRVVNRDRDLKLRNPQLDDSGRYTCVAINGWGHRSVEFHVEVFDPTTESDDDSDSIGLSETPSAPVWKDRDAMDSAIKSGVRLNPGERLELRCPARGNPQPEIGWAKNGVPTKMELSRPTSARFVIEGVEKTDSGLYTCRLDNVHGSLEAEFDVVVGNEVFVFDGDRGEMLLHSGTFGMSNVPSMTGGGDGILPPPGSLPRPPTPTIDQPQNMTVRAGHTAQFQCKVEWSKEKSMIRWLRKIDHPQVIRHHSPNATILHINGMHLLVLEQSSDAVRVFAANGGNGADKKYINDLTIHNVQKQDSGRYFCVVTNTAGQFVYRSAYLDVTEGPPYLTPIANVRNISVGLVILSALGSVTVLIIWLSCNNGKTESSSNAMSKPPRGTLPLSATTFATHSTSSTSTSSDSNNNNDKGCAIRGFFGTTLTTATTATTKRPPPAEHPPPPPPRIPLPEAPQSLTNDCTQMPISTPSLVAKSTPQQQFRNFPTSTDSPILWLQQNYHHQHPYVGNTSSMRRGPIQSPQQMLHRTARAEDEMSRMSSHIYASGSPIPPMQPECMSPDFSHYNYHLDQVYPNRHQQVLHPPVSVADGVFPQHWNQNHLNMSSPVQQRADDGTINRWNRHQQKEWNSRTLDTNAIMYRRVESKGEHRQPLIPDSRRAPKDF